MKTGCLKMCATLLELQAASLVALADAGSRCVKALADAQPVAGSARVGMLRLISEFDHARGPRPRD